MASKSNQDKTSPKSLANVQTAAPLQSVYDHIMLTEAKTPAVKQKLMLIKIEIALRKKKMKKSELFKQLGLSISTMSSMFSQTAPIKLNRIMQIEDILNVRLINY